MENMEENIKEEMSKIWQPIPSWHIGTEWMVGSQTGQVGSLEGGLFILALVKTILALIPLILSCIRCLCIDKENSNSSEV